VCSGFVAGKLHLHPVDYSILIQIKWFSQPIQIIKIEKTARNSEA
jgi:hypothetical protein